ncbi:PH domain-containing protein [Gracilibacillus salitolerans]|uniref:PH domain-containing protein n=1 Tax=Gracilibacillus salitolerans TaxID=2663022 RepID=A0A5Q2TME9_9BACI|nr:PH domain-containing protein [Gracilibacillus salitolerans]QGH35855.1 PH domain-containing protein [Gracilibacillus salitolerans]
MMRYHPLIILYRIYQLIKNGLILGILLFVVKRDSDFWLLEYGRYVFIVGVLLRVIYIVGSWFVETYEWEERTFQIKKGLFVKHTSTIPFSKIQNVTRHTTLFHKLFGLTSLTFETAMDGDDDAITFQVVSKQHAAFLLELVNVEESQVPKLEKKEQDQHEEEVNEAENKVETDHVIHFEPTNQDLLKASFTSLSFLAIIPIVTGMYDFIEPLLPDSDQYQGVLYQIINSRWLIIMLSIIAVVIAIIIGIVRTFSRYGKYRISSSATHIYIERGLLDETHFAIEKQRIQGLEIEQKLLKRIFGLAEVKLISSASPQSEDYAVSVNSLYPFLPIKRAYQLMEALLPDYHVEESMNRLTKTSLYMKLIKPSWFWIVVTAGLFYFKPTIFQIDAAWWLLSLLLLLIVIANRILDYLHTKYLISDDQLQWWHGGLTSRMFITKRRRVIEMSYSQSILQRIFKLVSISTMNRSTPTRIETINDVPLDFAQTFQHWYLQRQKDTSYQENG